MMQSGFCTVPVDGSKFFCQDKTVLLMSPDRRPRVALLRQNCLGVDAKTIGVVSNVEIRICRKSLSYSAFVQANLGSGSCFESSRPGELPPQSLTEPYVIVSHHTALQ